MTVANTSTEALPHGPSEEPAWLERRIRALIDGRLLLTFNAIALTAHEKKMASQAINEKYAPAVAKAIGWTVILTPSFLTLETGIVVSVLLPTTMVAGTAWFAVSLASMKKKFESFGTELTRDLFVAFSLSLLMLMLATSVSLTEDLWKDYLPSWAESPLCKLGSAVLALLVVGKLLFSIFAGSLKYDINDAMLSGQNEVAEKFFKESLSLLYTTAQILRTGVKLEVANYYLGLCFYEIFNNIQNYKGESEPSESLHHAIQRANDLIRAPGKEQPVADAIVLELVEFFMESCGTGDEIRCDRSFLAIGFELQCLRNGGEDQHVVDIRTAVVLREMSNLMETHGAALFSTPSAT